MRLLKSTVAFVLVFCMLAVTVVCSALAGDETALVSDETALVSDETALADDETALADDETALADDETAFEGDETAFEGVGTGETFFAGTPIDIESVPMTFDAGSEYSPRLTAPAKNNPYYYSDKNIYYKYGYGMPNCTAYAYGRAYEILGKEPKLCPYDAYKWFSYNKDNKFYSYGTTPKLGAIVCFKYKGYNQGHVAVVEKIVGDTVYYSNSAWGGREFYITTSPIDDPTDGYSGWEFQGFIYIGEYSSGEEEDGDVYKITSNTGVNLRSGAGTSYGSVGAIPCGTTVVVLETKKQDGYTWGYTNYNGVSGWFVTDFAELISSGNKQPTTPTEPTTEPTSKPQGLMGDADLDGDISVLDATQIQLFVASLATPNETQSTLSDVDGDGEISVLDATKILLQLAGLE